MKIRTLLTVSLIALMGMTSYAQEYWSLEKCINHAYTNNISIQNADLAVQRASVNLTQSKHARYPNLNGSSGMNLNFGRTIDPTSNSFITESFISNNISLSSNVTLFNGGAIRNGIKQSQLLKKASIEDKDQAINDVALNIAQTYLNVLFAIENLEIAKQQLKLTETQLDQIQKLVNAGSRAANEVLDVEAQIALNEQSIVDAENNVEISYLNLKQLLRLEPDHPIQVIKPQDLNVTLDPEQITFKELYVRALETQSFVRAGEMRVQSAAINVDIAQAQLLPSLGIGGFLGSNYNNKAQTIDGFRTERVEQEVFIDDTPVIIGTDQTVPNLIDNPYLDQIDENLSYGFGLQLNVPIYNRYNNKASIENAKLNTILEQNNLTQLKENLKITVQQALADARASKRRYLASEKSQKASKLSFENAQNRYDLGAINPIEYVTSKNTLENAEINLLIAKYEYIFRTKVLDFYLGNNLGI